MWLRVLPLSAALALTPAGGCAAGEPGNGAARPVAASGPSDGDARVTRLLRPIREKHGIPAVAGAIVTGRGLAAAGVVGVRKRGTDVPATLRDLWHLGSDTKAMTATLAARLAEENRIDWDKPVAEQARALAPDAHPDFEGLTLLHLLSHRAGLAANADWNEEARRGGTIEGQRARVARAALGRKPANAPGLRHEYSNLGYVVAGAVMEAIGGRSWEQQMREMVFTPLGMASAGFGGTGTRGRIDQPWPHLADGSPARTNGPETDNPPLLGPAGTVHATIGDWGRFIADQLRGARGEGGLLKPASYARLHTAPFDGEYALGWLVTERDWAGGTALNHCGCNTMNYANAWLAPRRDFAVLVCANQGGDEAFKATDEAVSALIRLHTADR